MFSQRLPTALNLKESFKTEYYIRASHTRGSNFYRCCKKPIGCEISSRSIGFHSVGLSLAKLIIYSRKRCGNYLIHIVILILSEPAAEDYIGTGSGEALYFS